MTCVPVLAILQSMMILFSIVTLNFEKFGTVRTLKIQKTRPNLDQKPFPKINNYEKTNKKGGKKKESNLPQLFFFLSSSFVYTSHNHLHKKTTFRCFSVLSVPSSKLNSKKIINFHLSHSIEESSASPWKVIGDNF